jgi:hypothetical protein
VHTQLINQLDITQHADAIVAAYPFLLNSVAGESGFTREQQYHTQWVGSNSMLCSLNKHTSIAVAERRRQRQRRNCARGKPCAVLACDADWLVHAVLCCLLVCPCSLCASCAAAQQQRRDTCTQQADQNLLKARLATVVPRNGCSSVLFLVARV